LKKKRAVIQVGPEGTAAEPFENPELPNPPHRGDPPLRG